MKMFGFFREHGLTGDKGTCCAVGMPTYKGNGNPSAMFAPPHEKLYRQEFRRKVETTDAVSRQISSIYT